MTLAAAVAANQLATLEIFLFKLTRLTRTFGCLITAESLAVSTYQKFQKLVLTYLRISPPLASFMTVNVEKISLLGTSSVN